MGIKGNTIELHTARLSDRKKIYTWLAESDITPSIMGPPDYPDHPVPSWEQFCEDYPPAFFNAKGDGKGRCYIIHADNISVGTIGYDLLDKVKNRVALDIWLRSEKDCGQGYGSDALNTLCHFLHEQYGITRFIISPSTRNKRAIAAFKKAGFEYIGNLSKEEQIQAFGQAEYDDNILMIKKLTN